MLGSLKVTLHEGFFAMNRCGGALIVFVAVAWHSSAALADDEIGSSDRRDIGRSHERWEARLSHIDGKLRREHRILGEDRSVLQTRPQAGELSFHINGINRRADWIEPSGRAFSNAINSRYRFSVLRDIKDGPFLLRGIDFTNQAPPDASTLEKVEITLSSPYALHPGIQRLCELINNPANRVRWSQVEKQEPATEVRALEIVINDSKCPIRSAIVKLDPGHDWCIREFEAIHQNGIVKYTSRVHYDAIRSGEWYPQELFYEFYGRAGGESLNDQLSELAICKESERSFTLSAFGLPEMGRPTKQGPNLFGYGFVAVGCVLIALAVAIKYRAARR